jgi:AcrR family transcriptional regulator
MILEAALPLVLEHGDKVSTLEIASAAGIAEGTVYRVFASKQELIEAVVDYGLDPAPTEEAIAAMDPDADLEKTVTDIVAVVRRRGSETWRLISTVGPDYRLRHKDRRRDRRPEMDSPALVQLMRRHQDELEADPAEAARILLAISVALTHPALITEPLPPERIAGYFLRGVTGTKRDRRGRC